MKFIYILIFFCSLGCGSRLPFIGNVPTGVILVDKSKQEILKDSEVFIGMTFNSARSVIDVRNDDIILGKIVSIVNSKYTWNYIFLVRAKDGKVKYQFDKVTLNNSYDFKKDDYILNKKFWKKAKVLVNEEMDQIAKKFELYIKQNHNDF